MTKSIQLEVNVWYKQWKVRSGCLEKFALGNSRESSDFHEGQTTTEDFPLFLTLLDYNNEEYEALICPRFNSEH